MTPSITPGARARCLNIMARIPGYSRDLHYSFFEWLLRHPNIKDLLMLGVYYGRDINFIQDILKHNHPGRVVRITGVDLFESGPLPDWPKEKRGMSWEAAGMGKAPDYDQAVKNCPGVTLFKANDEDFLNATTQKFDAVYCDTDHTEATVARQLGQIPRVCRKGAIVCGDDYSDAGMWGVKSAVTKGTTTHTVFGNYIWATRVENLKALSQPCSTKT